MIKTAFKYLLGGLFIGAGLLHFILPDLYVSIMPPYLPWPLLLVYVSGACEVLLGALVFFPRYSPVARWGLIALLLAILPANLHMALHPELFPMFTPTMLWLRVPFQAVLIAWVYRSTVPDCTPKPAA